MESSSHVLTNLEYSNNTGLALLFCLSNFIAFYVRKKKSSQLKDKFEKQEEKQLHNTNWNILEYSQ